MIVKYRDYTPILPGAKPDGNDGVTESEDKCYGMNHARIGYHLAKSWFLPEDICQAVLWHHNYAALQDASSDISMVTAKQIALALVAEEIFVRGQSLGKSSPEWVAGSEFALGQLDISPADVDEAAEEIAQEEAEAA
jgi:HD-like signal output (HDOD) protein